MSSSSLFLFAIAFQCIALYSVSGMKCYQCSSMQNEKCGKDFTYSDEDIQAQANLTVECPTACRKTENIDNSEGIMIYTRSCFNNTSGETLKKDFFKCEDLMVKSKVCYCKVDDDKICNGQQLLRPELGIIIFGLATLISKIL